MWAGADRRGKQLTPFVTMKMKPTRGRYGTDQHPINGSVFLSKWKAENGES